jgi:hypothetical protein
MFPLEVDLDSTVVHDHPHVGQKAQVNHYANEVLLTKRGKEVRITGVILKSGQIAGYEVDCHGETFYAPRKDFFVGSQMVEDVHLSSSRAQHIRQVLGHWGRQHDYYGPSWDGVEAFHFELAKATDRVVVESAGWYKYPSSTRPDMDGKDWRLVIPDRSGTVAVNCHSLLHDHVWTLSTTIFSTREIGPRLGRALEDRDHWTRTLLWTLAVARTLQTNGYDYQIPMHQITARIRAIPVLQKLVADLIPQIFQAHGKVFGRGPKPLSPVSIGLSRIRIQPSHVGRYERPTDEAPYGILTVHPKAWKDKQFLREVVKHELIHHVLERSDDPHGDTFQAMSKELGLPPKYRD